MLKEWKMELAAIEPVEAFLSRNVCPDRLALYQPIIEIFKTSENDSVLDAINSILSVSDDSSAADIIMELDTAFIKYLIQLIAEFDVIVRSDSMSFLYQLYQALLVLDGYDDHNYIVNVCQDPELAPITKLYTLVEHICAYGTVDEEEFCNAIVAVPLMLFSRLTEIHQKLLNELEDNMAASVPDELYVQGFKALIEKHPELKVVSLVGSGQIVPNTPVWILTNRITGMFEGYKESDADSLALELIGFYLLSDAPKDQLVTVIKDQANRLLGDINLLQMVCVKLNAKLTEVLNHAQTWILPLGDEE